MPTTAVFTTPPCSTPYNLYVHTVSGKLEVQTFLCSFAPTYFTAEYVDELNAYLASQGWTVTSKWHDHIEWRQAELQAA